MTLLTENEELKIIELVKAAEFKENRRKVPAWALRFVSLGVAVFFLMAAMLIMISGEPVYVLPLLLAVCWLFVAVIFHLMWLRCAENYVLHKILAANKKTEAEPPENNTLLACDSV